MKAHLEVMGRMAPPDRPELLDLPERLDLQGQPALQVRAKLERLDRQELLEQLDQLGLPVRRERLEKRELLVEPEPPDQLERQVRREMKARQAVTASRVSLEQQGQLESLEVRVLLAPRVLLELPVRRVRPELIRPFKARLGLRALLEPLVQVQLELLGRPAQREISGLRVWMVLMEQPDRPGPPEPQGQLLPSLVQLALLDQQALLGRQE